MQSKAKTVPEYLASLPADRRAAISEVRTFLLANLGKGFAESMAYGMIGYSVPLDTYPAGYHCDPKQGLPFAALASQKNYMSLYLMAIYESDDDPDSAWFRKAWAAAGKKLDMGKCCIRFKSVDDLSFGVLKKVLKKWSVKKFIATYEEMRAQQAVRKVSAKKAAGRPAAKAATRKKAKK